MLQAAKEENVELTSILTTHHHWDHSGGNEALVSACPNILVFGGDKRIPCLTQLVGEEDTIRTSSLSIDVIFTPCHTSGHVLYFLDPEKNNLSSPILFSGDTMFIGGCGRFFEGSGQDMDTALNQKIASLPPTTQIYCGHEYTVSNLKFGNFIEPSNEDLQAKLEWAKNERLSHRSTLPSTLEGEKKWNVFLRLSSPEIQKNLGVTPETPSATIMSLLRSRKDNWKA
eukprot:TRINITY_DN2666_c0_g1_i1.p1 TRINITY_DN2666_c0_g1~~TRINITY_DN2666_c0_g1_i1.p1  ORF type:complete len:227 (-),score=50.33 TRINITY_DN2666_c0_g1_i1:158-838(-)